VVVGRIEATNYVTDPVKSQDPALRIIAGGGIYDGGDIGTYDLVAAAPGAVSCSKHPTASAARPGTAGRR
jgi:hypothetical protein